jgi:hypothetical protein
VPDANDPTACVIGGRDSCENEDHLPTRPAGTTRLTFTAATDLMGAPRPVEIVAGVALAGRVTVLAGESGAGKTFVLLDLAAHVSAGLPWHGRLTRQGSVAYLSFEGDALGVRLRALHEVAGHRLEHVHVVRPHDPLLPRGGREGEECAIGELAVAAALERLAAALDDAGRPPIRLTIIDTVRASMAGSEDSSEHVSAYLRAVRRLTVAVPQTAIVLAHHAGWQDGEQQRKRERGSSAWRGNCDITLYLEAGAYDSDRGAAELTVRALKMRDDERPAPLHLLRQRVELCESHHGDPVTSCVIATDRRSREDRTAAPVATVEQHDRLTDLQMLQAINDRPAMATSQDRLGVMLAMRKGDVAASIARLLQRGWIDPPIRQRQPYAVTDLGRQTLETGEWFPVPTRSDE